MIASPVVQQAYLGVVPEEAVGTEDGALGDGFPHHLVDQGDAVALLDGAQCLPAQHHGAVEQHDALHLGLECRLEEPVQTRR